MNKSDIKRRIKKEYGSNPLENSYKDESKNMLRLVRIYHDLKEEKDAQVIGVGNSGAGLGAGVNRSEIIPDIFGQGCQNITEQHNIFAVDLLTVSDTFLSHKKFS